MADLAAYARRGYVAASFDCRYHGVRAMSPPDRTPEEAAEAEPRDVYQEAIFRAFKGVSEERPFLLDNAWDAMALVGALRERADVDPGRVAATGISLGGMIAWLLAATDGRVCAAAPMLGVQDFEAALGMGLWEGRVESLGGFFSMAAADAGSGEVEESLVRSAWDRLLPGMIGGWDVPFSLPWVAPRPLLVLNGEVDERCPVPALQRTIKALQEAFEREGSAGESGGGAMESLRVGRLRR